MRADSLPADPFRISMRKVESFCFRPFQSEFVLVTPGCDMRVTAALHIGIHPNRSCRWLAASSCQSRRLFDQNLEFRFRLSVEQQNSYPSPYPSRTPPHTTVQPPP